MAGKGQMRQAVQRVARAKVNLALHVVGRRADGYHLLDSLVAFADFGDVVTVEPAAALSLTITGPMGDGLSAGPDNLVLKAALAFASPLGAAITLDKRLPVASGIGGGSADAAAALRALAALWGCDLPSAAQVLALGADVPVCLAGQSCRMAGIGDQISPVALPAAYLVLVNPGEALGTAAVFSALARRDNASLPKPDALPDAAALAAFLHLCRNDLQAPALALVPQIGDVLAALSAQEGCLLARMSGSGATCFGLFATPGAAERAALSLRSTAGWWVQAAPMVG
ncbi:MAG: 4-(cytidine 5'-diphospho)-2-C-methyl-D-erythritol kinase [Pseudomonadota bacterium]